MRGGGNRGEIVDLADGRRAGHSGTVGAALLGNALFAKLTFLGGVNGPGHMMNAPLVGASIDRLGGRLSRGRGYLLPCFIFLLLLLVLGGLLVLRLRTLRIEGRGLRRELLRRLLGLGLGRELEVAIDLGELIHFACEGDDPLLVRGGLAPCTLLLVVVVLGCSFGSQRIDG